MSQPATAREPSGIESRLLAAIRVFSPVDDADWRAARNVLVRHRVLVAERSLPLVGLSALTVAFEFTGIFSLLPLLQFVQADQSLSALAAKSEHWRTAIAWSQRLGIPIGLTLLAALTISLLICRQIVFYITARTLADLRERLAESIRLDVSRKLFEARPSTIRAVGSGSFVTRVNQQAQGGASIASYFFETVQITLTFLIFAVGVALVSPWIIILGTACAAIIVLCLNMLVRSTYATNAALARQYNDLGQFLAQFYNAWRLIKLTDRVTPFIADLAQHTSRIRDANLALVRQSGLTQLLAMPLAALLGLGSLVILTGHVSLSVAELTLIIVVLFRLGPMAEALVKLRQSSSGAITALRRLEDLHDAAVATREIDTGTTPFKAPQRSIGFHDVHFSYPGRASPALAGLTLDIPANRLTAIIGPSGAGKSTMLDLLARLDEPDRGSITLDGTPLPAFRLGELRRNIAVVDQAAVLVDGSIEDNLRLVKPTAGAEEIAGALRFASADAFVAALPEGLATRIGENGAQLSGGQRQRLTIARAVLSGASIIVFDEPTSALDFESEAAFRTALTRLVAGQRHTVLLVAHRFTTIRDADYVVILNGGRIEEAAAPAALKREASYYQRMIEAQAGDESQAMETA